MWQKLKSVVLKSPRIWQLNLQLSFETIERIPLYLFPVLFYLSKRIQSEWNSYFPFPLITSSISMLFPTWATFLLYYKQGLDQ